MESLIPIINQLQDVCHTASIPLPIDLPQIVVVGTQSSGKSSVIESIVRREFLPRGSGIVTRRPLVIRLFKTNDDRDWAMFERQTGAPQPTNSLTDQPPPTSGDHPPQPDYSPKEYTSKEYTSFDEVREAIERETERRCGKNRGICTEPIKLSVYSKSVVNLTLVDLPGLIKIPVGDQPQDIEEQIRALITGYIRNPNSIILAVAAANSDFVTCEALKLAREVDPEGRRTLVVLTKLDMMGRGEDALDVLTGKVIPVRLGIIGVVNRSQEDIINKKPFDKVIEDEASFFQRRYPNIAEKNGQPYLAKKLSQLLMRHIRDCLPDLKERIKSLIFQYQAQLDTFGQPVTDKGKTIFKIVNKFALSYCNTIKGDKRRVKTAELCGGARIQYIFYNSFGRGLESIDPLESLDHNAILTAARNAAGMRTAICIPDVFELLITNQIKRLEDPSLRCVDLVHEEMRRSAKQCGDDVRLELIRFPKLREKVEEILARLLNERLPITRQQVSYQIDCETAIIDLEHPRLRDTLYGEDVSARNGLTNGFTDDTSLRHERELRECEMIAKKIKAYFDIVREDIKVHVPKVITHSMINHIVSNLESELVDEIYRKELFETLLSESDDVARRRKETLEMVAALEKASEIINTIHYPR